MSSIAERKYDPSLVAKIASGAREVVLKGYGLDKLCLEIRPVPDDSGEHVLDPRVFERAKKRSATRPSASVDVDIIALREKPNKENYAIDDASVDERVIVMDFGDRGIPLHLFVPKAGITPHPVLAYFHGGGFTVGNIGQYRNPLRLIAQISGCVVAYTEYRLAPECPYPAGLNDCSETIDWLCEHANELGIDASRVALAGDSAGGSLSNAVVQMQAEKGCIKLVIEMYPLIDAGPVPDAWSYDLYPVLESQRDEAMSRVSRFLAPSDSLAETYTRGNRSTLLDPLISVIYCDDLSVFPRTVVVTADYDYLRYQGELFAKRLFDSGVSVRAIRYAGCDHGFFETCGVMPQVEDLCHIFAEELGKL